MKKILKKISLGLLGISLLAACSGTKTGDSVSNKLIIKAPIPELDIKFEAFDLDNSKEQVLKTRSGSQIRIPKDAIVGKDGNAVGGNIKIKYREFHDAVDIFLSGIPMDYNAQGEKRTMQTAGMFELRAEQNGELLQVASGKTIGVRMASFEAGNDYSFFHLDESGKGWEFLDNNYEIEVNVEKEKLKKSIQGKAPSMPFPLDDKYFSFDYSAILDVMFNDDYYKIRDNRENPAIADKARKYGLMWLNTRSEETIVYKGVTQPAAMMVWKRVSGAAFPAWMKDENRDHTTLSPKGGNLYNLSVEAHEGGKTYTAVIEAVMPISALFKFAPEYWEKNYKEAMAKVGSEMERLKKEADVFRSFEVSGFGIYNYDKLMKEENIVKIIANFMPDESIKKGNEIYNMDIVYCIPDDNKTVIKLPKEDWGKVNLLPGNRARFITVLPGAAIGVYTAEKYMALDFESLRKKDNPSVDFVLVKTIEKADAAGTLREALSF